MSPVKEAIADKDAADKAPKASDREAELSAQVAQLQADIKSLAATLAGLAEEKMKQAESHAGKDVQNLLKAGERKVDQIEDEFGALEKQIKDTIRQKPLTSMAGAIAFGFLLAVLAK